MGVKEEGYNKSDTGNWNVASDYSRLKIMRHLYLSDEYSNIAIFGESSLLDELQTDVPTDILKLAGLNRLINCLIMLIDNSMFALSKTGQDQLKKHREKLKKTLAILHLLSKTTKTLNKDKKTVIITEKFNKVLNGVLDIRANINEPLNKSNLIFIPKEEFDPQAYKKMIKDGAINRG